MKKKKPKLKKQVKFTIVTMFTLLMITLTVEAINNMNRIAQECDNAKGYICSYYEIKNFKLEN